MCFLNIKSCQRILLHQIHKNMILKKASHDLFSKSWETMSKDINQLYPLLILLNNCCIFVLN